MPGFQTCFWRGVGPNVNVFSIESFVDRLARESGTDPVDFRRSIIGKQVRARAVLDLAAEKAGWGTPLTEGSGRGVSLGVVFGSYLSTVAEVAVDKQGGVQVKRLVCAVDCGTAVDPDNVVAQIQGGMVFGLTAALWGDITVAKGRVQQSNFHDYRMLRINEMPQIEVHLVRNEESPGRNRRGRDRPRAACRRQCSVGSDRPGDHQAADRADAPGAGRSGMSWFWRHRLVSLIAAAIVVVAAFWVGRMLFQPGPLAFAGGSSVALQDYKGASPVGVPAELAGADDLTKGKYLTEAADCAACHTTPGGKPYAGGFAFKLPFGTIYTPNITPDTETGIGSWTDAQFLRAMHEGIAEDGSRLYPAFPYASYTLLADADVLLIKRYLASLSPVRQKNLPNTFVFPFNQRWLMAIWSAFFNSNERFQPISRAQS